MPATRYLLLWFFLILLFFSAANSKLLSYLLPAFPAAALLVAVSWDRLLRGPSRSRRRWTGLSLMLPGIILVLALAAAISTRLPQIEARYQIGLAQAFVPLAVLGIGVIVAMVSFCLRRYRLSFLALVSMVAVFIILVTVLVLPQVSVHRSTKNLAVRIDELLPEGTPMYFYNRLYDSALFYTHRRAVIVETPGELQALLEVDRPIFVLIRNDEYEGMETIRPLTRIVAPEGRTWLISNVPDNPGGRQDPENAS